jgi:hypothetical protein
MGSNDITELLMLTAAERIAIAERLWASVVEEVELELASATGDEMIGQRRDGYPDSSNPSVQGRS